MRLTGVQLSVDTSSRYRMNEKDLFGKTFDDVWRWNKSVMEDIEEFEFEHFTLQQSPGLCHNCIASGTKLHYVHHFDVQDIKRHNLPLT
jgi:predicted metallo-beta-lactamase superfamily hydrolase